MSLFVCAKCGCVDNTATSSYWMLTNEYMVDKFDYAKELQPHALAASAGLEKSGIRK